MPAFGLQLQQFSRPLITKNEARLWSFLGRRVIATFGLLSVVCSMTLAQTSKQSANASAPDADSISIENPGVPVEVDGRPILFIYGQIGAFKVQERAASIQQRIIALAKRPGIAFEAIHPEDQGTWTEIVVGNERLMGITEADAKIAGKPRPELAAEYTEIIRHVVKQYRDDHTWHHFLMGALYSSLATAGLVGLLFTIFLIRRGTRSKIEGWLVRHETQRAAKPLGLRLTCYLSRPFVTIGSAAFWIIVVALLQTYVTLVLRFFPSTRYISYQISNWVFSELAVFGRMLIGYIPNFIVVLFICLVTYSLIKLNQYIFEEIRDDRLTIHGFYHEWAEPTAKLVRVLVLAAAAIVIFPYVPGSDSPAFKGISVFLGVLLSFGSTSAVAHAVAGTILIYMRAFQVGDFVRIGNDVGEVTEKTLLVTRICTQKNEVVTIPNGAVLGGVVINYSAQARQKGVIFHTAVTIGYNAPWRKVHELLIAAAQATDGVLHDPRPFVLQTALNDFYVAYELNAYTATPRNMQTLYSVLHQNIQDKFNEAGVEINSPHYTSLRDGNRVTIPDNYLPEGYESTVFEIREVNGSQNVRERDKGSVTGIQQRASAMSKDQWT